MHFAIWIAISELLFTTHPIWYCMHIHTNSQMMFIIKADSHCYKCATKTQLVLAT